MDKKKKNNTPQDVKMGLRALQVMIIAAIALSIVLVIAIRVTEDRVDTNDAVETSESPPVDSGTWQVLIENFDGVEMVFVPEGCFMMGSSTGDPDEVPEHQQCITDAFWIDRYEVSNSQYGSLGCENYSAEPEQPRNCVNWFDALAHCQARGGSLPTEAQWEYAARGPENRNFPWGDTFNSDNLSYASSSMATVGSYPGGASWVGAMDMIGNVWEWVSSKYSEYPYNPSDGRENLEAGDVLRVLRGGAYIDNNIQTLRGSDRGWDDPMSASSVKGFRCVRPAA